MGCAQSDSDNGDQASGGKVGEALSANGTFYATMTWDPLQLKAGNGANNTATVAVTGPNREPLTEAAHGAVILKEFHPEMPGMGHGTNEDDQVISAMECNDSGSFKVSGIHFSMAGGESEWVVTLKVAIGGVDDIAKVP